MTDWAARYAAGDMPWEKGYAAPPLEEIDAALFDGRVFVPGCGYGHDVRRISRADNTVIGLDLTEAAVTKARSFPRTGHEEYVLGNLFALKPEWHGAFDAVVEHTCFCAINPADRGRYVEAVQQALKRGGRLIAIFYLDPGSDEGPPWPVSEEELDARFDPLFILEQKWTPRVAYPGREGREQVRIYRQWT